MKIFLATYGTRGDFEPFLNFAEYAQAKGHEVILAGTEEFISQIKNTKIKTEIVAGAIQKLISNQVSFLQFIKQFNESFKPDTVKMFNQVVDLIKFYKPDFVLYHPKVMSAPIAAKHIGAKSCLIEMIPLSMATKEFGLIPGVGKNNYGIFNRLTFKIIEISSSIFKKDLQNISQRLAENNKKPDCYMCLVSPSLIREPKDWPSSAHLVGPWFSKNIQTDLDSELNNFLEKPTIYVGFGSMSDKNFASRISQIVEAVIDMGYQALLVTGWGKLDSRIKFSEPNKVMIRNSVSHRAVFPKVLAAIHHGGSGTTHAALEQATPSVIIPFITDQPWWASRLFEKGLGPKPLAKNRLTTEKLKNAINEALTKKTAVAEISQEFKKVDPMGVSLAILEDLVAKK